jgi:NAD(P)H dehydrogenase (quinone)
MINAAADAGVRHVAYLDSWTVHWPTRITTLAGRCETAEERLRELFPGRFTVLRGGYFMSNTYKQGGRFSSMVKAGVIRGHDAVRLPMVDLDDIGRSCARVLADVGVGHEDAVYEMSGPAALSYADMAATFSRVLGYDVRFEAVTRDAALAALSSPKLDFERQVTGVLIDEGERAVPLSDAVKRLTGRHTTFEEWLHKDGVKQQFARS